MKLPLASRMLEWIGRIDHRRRLPAFAWGNNIKKLRKYLEKLGPIEQPAGKVAYFVDLYATYNDHELGRAVVDLLRHNGVEVIIPEQHEAAMPSISYGDIARARKTIEHNVRHLAEAVRAGYTIVASEPTAALCLKEEYLDVVDSPDARLVAENTLELTDYLGRMLREGTLKEPTHAVPMTLAYHEPCHYAALQIETGTLALLERIEGVEIEMLPNSCCGIAGTFGFQKKNYDLSILAGLPMLGPLRESRAPYGLTECATCKMQMEQCAAKPTLHPAKILAKSYGLS
jgi:Fe-S oxidoreductase